MPGPDLMIFDCDGVLVDSEVIAARVEAELITEAGYPIEPEDVSEIYAGLTFTDIMLRIEREAAIPFQASLITRAESLIDKRLAAEVRAVDGAREAIVSTDLKRCICSNSSSARLDISLARTGLKPLFEGRIFSALDIPSRRPKPAPDVFLHAAETMGADPANSFVIEDSVHGVRGAVAAGMKVIGFTGASHSYLGHGEALSDAGAVTVIRRWKDFPEVISALSSWSDV